MQLISLPWTLRTPSMEPPAARLITPSEAPRRLSLSLDILQIDGLVMEFRLAKGFINGLLFTPRRT